VGGFLITDLKFGLIGIKANVISKYIDNFVSLKTENMMGGSSLEPARRSLVGRVILFEVQ
jgi:hypothetical protein